MAELGYANVFIGTVEGKPEDTAFPAVKKALEDAGLSESDVNVVRCGLDYDDGRTEYEIEFYKDRTEYDYTLDAFTGEILEKSIEEGDD